MLRNVIWTRFFTKLVCWQNYIVIFEKSYLPHMTSCLAEIWSVDRPLSQESKTIECALIGLFGLSNPCVTRDSSSLMFYESLGADWAVESMRHPSQQFVDYF